MNQSDRRSSVLRDFRNEIDSGRASRNRLSSQSQSQRDSIGNENGMDSGDIENDNNGLGIPFESSSGRTSTSSFAPSIDEECEIDRTTAFYAEKLKERIQTPFVPSTSEENKRRIDRFIKNHVCLSRETLEFDYNSFFSELKCSLPDLSFNTYLFEKLFPNDRSCEFTVLDFVYSQIKLQQSHPDTKMSFIKDSIKIVKYFCKGLNLKSPETLFSQVLKTEDIKRMLLLVPVCVCDIDEDSGEEESDDDSTFRRTRSYHIFMNIVRKNVLNEKVDPEDLICPSCDTSPFIKKRNEIICKNYFLYIPLDIVFRNLPLKTLNLEGRGIFSVYEQRLEKLTELLSLKSSAFVPIIVSRDDVPCSSSSSSKINVSSYMVENDVFFSSITLSLSDRNVVNFLLCKELLYRTYYSETVPKPFVKGFVHDMPESCYTRCMKETSYMKHCILHRCKVDSIDFTKNRRKKNGDLVVMKQPIFSHYSNQKIDLGFVISKISDEDYGDYGLNGEMSVFSFLHLIVTDPYRDESNDSFHNESNILGFYVQEFFPPAFKGFVDKIVESSKSPVELTRFRKLFSNFSLLKNTEKTFHLLNTLPIVGKICHGGLLSDLLIQTRKVMVANELTNKGDSRRHGIKAQNIVLKLYDDKLFVKRNSHKRLKPSAHALFRHSSESIRLFGSVLSTREFEGKYQIFRNLKSQDEKMYLSHISRLIMMQFTCKKLEKRTIRKQVVEDLETIISGKGFLNHFKLMDNIEGNEYVQKLRQFGIRPASIEKISFARKIKLDDLKYMICTYRYQAKMKSSNYNVAITVGFDSVIFVRVKNIICVRFRGGRRLFYLEIEKHQIEGFVKGTGIPILSKDVSNEEKDCFLTSTSNVVDIVLFLNDCSRCDVKLSKSPFCDDYEEICNKERFVPIFLTKKYKYFKD